jgi:sialate O-acetylesterase
MNPPALKLAPLFQDGMILPCERTFPVWGRGQPGGTVHVQAGPHTLSGRVADNGQWELAIPPLPAGEVTPFTVEAGGERIILRDVLAGDLWLCAGQSNMAMAIQQTGFTEEPAARMGDRSLRLFVVGRQLALAPGASIAGKWKTTHPEPSADRPALPFHFGRLLRQRLGSRPVGLLVSASGDTPMEAWMSREALTAAGYAPALTTLDTLFRTYPDAGERIGQWQKEWRERAPEYNQAVADWMPAARQARAAGTAPPPKPARPAGPGDPQTPTGLHYGMLAPLFRLPIRGIVWYQGETDAIRGTGAAYAGLFRSFIEDCRRQCGQPDLPFLFVQIARHDDIQSSLPPGQWAVLREAQAQALSLPRVTMIVGLDQGDSEEIHPKRKEELARRLALAALAEAYGHADVPHRGPEFDRAEGCGQRIAIHLRHAETGLSTADGHPPRGFQVAGPDRRFVDARTDLGNGTILLWNDAIRQPHAVRYAWADDPDSNVCTATGWPLPPFQCAKGDPAFVENSGPPSPLHPHPSTREVTDRK